jgi:hypothetical protein
LPTPVVHIETGSKEPDGPLCGYETVERCCVPTGSSKERVGVEYASQRKKQLDEEVHRVSCLPGRVLPAGWLGGG